MNPDEAIYLFCFTHQGLPKIEGQGVEGAYPLEQWTFQDVVALISKVPLHAFTGSQAEAHLQNIAWIAPRAYRHEAVVEEAMQYTSVFPARFGTLFFSYERLEHLVKTHYETITQFLKQTTEKSEWSLKTLLNQNKAEQHFIDTLDPTPVSSSPGAQYLQTRQRRLKAEKQIKPWAQETCQKIAQDLQPHTEDMHMRKLLQGSVPDKEGDLVMNLSLLVTKPQLKTVQTHVDSLNKAHMHSGLEFILSGPWPPYSFCPPLEQTQAGDQTGDIHA